LHALRLQEFETSINSGAVVQVRRYVIGSCAEYATIDADRLSDDGTRVNDGTRIWNGDDAERAGCRAGRSLHRTIEDFEVVKERNRVPEYAARPGER
jgi:hypothetical protein